MPLHSYITKVLNKAFKPLDKHDESQPINDVWDSTHAAMERLAERAFFAGRKTRHSIFAGRDVYTYRDFDEFKNK